MASGEWNENVPTGLCARVRNRNAPATKMTETVHAALEEVVRRRRLRALLELRPALDLDDLRSMRTHRFAEHPEPYGEDAGPKPT